MARLDVRVDGRTRLSRTVDEAVVSAVLAAATNAIDGTKTEVRNFGGKVVRTPKAKPKAKPEPEQESPEKDSPATESGSD